MEIGNNYDVTGTSGNEDILNSRVVLKSFTFTEINCNHHNHINII